MTRDIVKVIVVLSGPVAAGKTSLARELVGAHDFVRLSTRDLILTELPRTPATRRELQLAGERLDKLTGGFWVAQGLINALSLELNEHSVVVDSVRRFEQIEFVRGVVSPVLHVHVTAALAVLKERYERVSDDSKELLTYESVTSDPTESQVETLGRIADLRIDSGKSSILQGVSAVASAIGLIRLA